MFKAYVDEKTPLEIGWIIDNTEFKQLAELDVFLRIPEPAYLYIVPHSRAPVVIYLMSSTDKYMGQINLVWIAKEKSLLTAKLTDESPHSAHVILTILKTELGNLGISVVDQVELDPFERDPKTEEEETLEKIEYLFRRGFTDKQIGSRLGLPKTTLGRKKDQLGLVKKRKRSSLIDRFRGKLEELLGRA